MILRDSSPPGPHGFGLASIVWFVRLVRANVSLRSASRVLKLLFGAGGLADDAPDWTTGRLWLQRLGHAKLTQTLEPGDDWVWLLDHSVQIGQEKCLVILGIRLRDLPPAGESLRHEQMELVELLPRISWTKQDVAAALEAATARTGVPRAIVDDHGADLTGGVALFREQHPQTSEIYDAKHKAACVLKRRLEHDPRWAALQTQVGRTRCAIQQTELAFLVPPGTRLKSRFMNLEPLLRWATHILSILATPPDVVCQHSTPQRLAEKLGWLAEYQDAIREWASWQAIIDVVVKFVNGHGHDADAAGKLRSQLPENPAFASTRELSEELLAFVSQESAKAKAGERLPGSTEVLESCFGRFKVLEKDQSRGGFTSLLLSFGALLTQTTAETIRSALEHSRTQDVWTWCREKLGTTVFAKRKLAFQASATKPG
jgi:hypothetical protein